MNRRRRRLHLLAAGLTLAAALTGLERLRSPEPGPAGAPAAVSGPAAYRPDGGQTLGSGGSVHPNPLTELNLGRRIDLAAAHPWFLAALPGLGGKSAVKARSTGRLPARAIKNLGGLVRESDARTGNAPDQDLPQDAP